MRFKDYLLSIFNAGIFSYYLSNYSFKYYYILNIMEFISIIISLGINLTLLFFIIKSLDFIYIRDGSLIEVYILSFVISSYLSLIIFDKFKNKLKNFLQLFFLIGDEDENINRRLQKLKDYILSVNIAISIFLLLYPSISVILHGTFSLILHIYNNFFNIISLDFNFNNFLEALKYEFLPFISIIKLSIFILTLILLQSSLFFHIFNALLEFLYLPNVDIIYFSSKEVLDENKFLLKEKEQFPNKFFQSYQGTILIPKTVKNEMFSKGIIKEFLEYLLKTLYSYYIVLSSKPIIFRYIPIFVNFIISTFYPIISIIFLNYFLLYLYCSLGFDKITVISLGLVMFMFWYIFFLEKTLKLSHSNIFLFLSKYLHRRLINNIHMVYTSPYNEKKEINVYTVLLGKGIMEESGRNLNLVFQIISILIINIAVVVIITYFLGNFECH